MDGMWPWPRRRPWRCGVLRRRARSARIRAEPLPRAHQKWPETRGRKCPDCPLAPAWRGQGAAGSNQMSSVHPLGRRVMGVVFGPVAWLPSKTIRCLDGGSWLNRLTLLAALRSGREGIGGGLQPPGSQCLEGIEG